MPNIHNLPFPLERYGMKNADHTGNPTIFYPIDEPHGMIKVGSNKNTIGCLRVKCVTGMGSFVLRSVNDVGMYFVYSLTDLMDYFFCFVACLTHLFTTFTFSGYCE